MAAWCYLGLSGDSIDGSWGVIPVPRSKILWAGENFSKLGCAMVGSRWGSLVHSHVSSSHYY